MGNCPLFVVFCLTLGDVHEVPELAVAVLSGVGGELKQTGPLEGVRPTYPVHTAEAASCPARRVLGLAAYWAFKTPASERTLLRETLSREGLYRPRSPESSLRPRLRALGVPYSFGPVALKT